MNFYSNQMNTTRLTRLKGADFTRYNCRFEKISALKMNVQIQFKMKNDLLNENYYRKTISSIFDEIPVACHANGIF